MNFLKIMDTTENQIQQYLKNGRIPFSLGYKPYKIGLLRKILADQDFLNIFKVGGSLPEDYGTRLDERVVEYPWVLSHIDTRSDCLLDAGSTLNYPYLLDLPVLNSKQIVIMTLAPEHTEKRENVSYIYGDLRDIVVREHYFDWIVCISTLEHVGMDNTKLYTRDFHYKENTLTDYQKVLLEFKRILRPGGHLLITVPFGKAQNLGWLQQFDMAGINNITSTFGKKPIALSFFQHKLSGWVLSDSNSCGECEYFDVHAAFEPAKDGAAAARAVACLEFIK